MNSTTRMDSREDAFLKNSVSILFGIIVNCINGAFVYTYFKSTVFQQDPRYIMYIHLVINDMIMLTFSVALQVLTYTVQLTLAHCCIMLLILITTDKNSPLNLAGMAVERYIAVCRPLHHTQICTVQRTYGLIALIWVMSIIPALINVIVVLATQPITAHSRPTICYSAYIYNTPYLKAQNMVIEILLFSFVFLILIITYLKVLCAAQVASGSNQTSARNARNTILLHGVQLFLCMLSYISPLINVIFVTTWPHARTKILFVTFLISYVLPRLLSPLIYGIRDKKFSSQLRMHLCHKYHNSVEKKVTAVGQQRRSKEVQR